MAYMNRIHVEQGYGIFDTCAQEEIEMNLLDM
jgi:hypothetical protein